ncbi:hypothetical protein F4814DRAFT_403516 [Daldinia grandis]|nr:hypothetical protein F4814DRAFT_403516 [Daldinia grandis]
MKTSKLGNYSFPISYVIHLNLCTLWPTVMVHPFKPQTPPSSADNFNLMILSSFIHINSSLVSSITHRTRFSSFSMNQDRPGAMDSLFSLEAPGSPGSFRDSEKGGP